MTRQKTISSAQGEPLGTESILGLNDKAVVALSVPAPSSKWLALSHLAIWAFVTILLVFLAQTATYPFAAPILLVIFSGLGLKRRFSARSYALLDLLAALVLIALIPNPRWLAPLLLISPAVLVVDRRIHLRWQAATLFKTRTVSDVEAQLDEVHETNRRLRLLCSELRFAIKNQSEEIELANLAQRLFRLSVSDDNDRIHQNIAQTLMEYFNAGGAVLWSKDGAEDYLVKAVAGNIAAAIQSERLSLQGGGFGKSLRAEAERLATQYAKVELTPQLKTERRQPNIPNSYPGDGAGALPALSATLTDSETVISLIALTPARGSGFEPRNLEQLNSVAPVLSACLIAANHRVSASRTSRELAMLYELGRLLQTTSEPDSLRNALLNLIQKVIPYENCTIFSWDAEGNCLEPKATRGRVVNLIEHISFPKGPGISGWVLQQRKQVFICDLSRMPDLVNVELLPPRVASFISVPMIVRDEAIGVINVSHSKPNAFQSNDVQLLTILAGQAAIALKQTALIRSLEAMAITDESTQIFNRRYFQMRLDDELKRSRRYKLPVSLMMLYLDHFKRINDRFGHAVGDEVLRELAKLLVHSLRETETIARYGGEEFVVILPTTHADEAAVAAERVRRTIAEHRFASRDGLSLSVTASIGLATCPTNSENPSQLIALADQALYAAKHGGRNRVVRCHATDQSFV